jgi:hypothetical protein|tara:strand:+ start:574 stop:2145 length:1572 start_codon:yes stop_codon:yes gene_type:complete
MKSIKSLIELKEQIKVGQNYKEIFINIGNFDLRKEKTESQQETYEMLKYLFNEVCPPLKYFTWGDFLEQRKKDKFTGFNGLRNQASTYHYFLPHGYTAEVREVVLGHAGMDMKNTEDEYIDILDVANWDKTKENQNRDHPHAFESLTSMYYHSAKAHWIIQDIQKNGLIHPIQGITKEVGDKFGMAIHPGSVRSGCFEEMEDPSMELMIWDKHDVIDIEPITLENALEFWENRLEEQDCDMFNLSFSFVEGHLEFQHDLSNLNFRPKVHEFNRKVSKLAKGKPLSIYIGYDSRHTTLPEINKHSILESIKKGLGSGWFHDQVRWEPEIKFLDKSKIPEYNREYANQSTEFTYSRFLIPYLENYEGFSIFLDDDFIFEKSILPMFYYLNPDDAIACVKYPHYDHDATKFDGEVNIDYPCKLWSSLMIFNNGHEDCKKLTPEVVNTWTGKQLHQFEWTDKISEIPQKYIFVEGYDDPEEKWDFTGIHYTRGGPWVKGMDYSDINNLEYYNKWLNKHKNEVNNSNE